MWRSAVSEFQGDCSAEIKGPEKGFGDEEVGDEDDDAGLDEGGDCGAADAFGAAFDAEALVAADGGDDEAKDERLDESNDEITELQRVDGARPELSGRDVESGRGNGETAEQAGADAEGG